MRPPPHRCGQRPCLVPPVCPHRPRLVPPVCPRWWGFGRRFALAAGGGGFGRWWGVWPLAAGRCPSAARTSVVIEAGIGFVPEAIFVSDFRGLHEQLGGGSLRQSPAGGGSAAAPPWPLVGAGSAAASPGWGQGWVRPPASHAPLWPQEARWIACGQGELGWMRPMVDALLWPLEARWRGVRPPPWSVGGLRPAAAASPWAALAESTHGNPLIRKAFPAASCEPGCCTLSH